MPNLHTPGPWEVEAASDDPFGEPHCHYILASGGDTWNCIVSTFARPNIHNARLIAAAPELLEALEVAITYTNKRGDKGWTKGQCNKLTKLAQAAIAKAKGEE